VAADLVGSEKCGTCHAEEYREQRDLHMARTGQSVDVDRRDGWFSDDRLKRPIIWPASAGAAPRFVIATDGIFLETGPSSSARARVDAVIGSGARGFTPVSTEPGRAIRELRLSFSAREDAWFTTPGAQENPDPDPLGPVHSAEQSRDCLECHGTLLTFRGDRLDVDASILGIQCERCHGPGRAHVEAMTRSEGEARIFNPGNLPVDEQAPFCGQCHRRPSDIDPLDIMTRAPAIARHAGAGLMLSACFRDSPREKTIACVDCHDPHRNAEPRSEAYREACLRCHRSPESVHRSQPISSTANCISCHMPVEEKAFYGLRFTDHWIRRPGAPAPLDSSERDEYLEYLETSYRGATLRPELGPEKRTQYRIRLGEVLYARKDFDEAFRFLREGLSTAPSYGERLRAATLFRQSGRVSEAVQTLEDAIRDDPGRTEAYLQQGELLQAQGKLDDAMLRYRRALELEPDSAPAHNSVGSVLASRGNLDEAVAHFRRAIELKSDYVEARNNLGLSLRLTGQLDEAVVQFREVLRLRPQSPPALNSLARILAAHPDPDRRDPEEALRLAEQAAELTEYSHPAILDTLAVAYASAGLFDRATAVGEEALRLANESNAGTLAAGIRERLILYRRKEPYVEVDGPKR
jgi:tetratricopeptide (TPR) repeat protein